MVVPAVEHVERLSPRSRPIYGIPLFLKKVLEDLPKKAVILYDKYPDHAAELLAEFDCAIAITAPGRFNASNYQINLPNVNKNAAPS
jgi:hypothetical protein